MEILKFEELPSTQDYAKNLAKNGEQGKTICAITQTGGRGRFGRKWESNTGGLWFSIILTKKLPEDRLNIITQTVGVLVFKILKQIPLNNLKIKWPNDIYLNKKKLLGIICENVEGRVIIGIGINTNNEPSALNSTSIFLEAGKKIDNDSLLKSIVEIIEKNIYSFNKEDIVSCFNENMAFKDEECFVTELQKKVLVRAMGNSGQLIVLDKGIYKEVNIGEVIH